MNFNEMSETLTVMSEYSYLIHLLRCAIHGEIPRELPEELSFEKVYQYAMDHDVANLAFYAVERLHNRPDAELYAQWGRRRDLALMRDMNQEFARHEILTEFDSRGIPFKELQGTILKRLYPRPEYRTMSDLDFIVEKTRLEECSAILENLGYNCSWRGRDEVNGIRRPGIFVELHTHYFSKESDYYGTMELTFGRKAFAETAASTELYLYSILHAAKHYFAGGCGIRRVLDMYYLDANYGDVIDRNHVNAVLEKAGVERFAQEFSDLARAWFGTGDGSAGVTAMEQYILGSGLHGKRENFISSKLRRIEKGSSYSFGAKIRYLFTRLFPGDQTMLRHYPVLRKCRILYPFCWFHRIIRMLLGKNRDMAVADLKLVLRTKGDSRDIMTEPGSDEATTDKK